MRPQAGTFNVSKEGCKKSGRKMSQGVKIEDILYFRHTDILWTVSKDSLDIV